MRILLVLLFFVLLAADTLGLNLSLAPGLSVKNAFLYLIFFSIAVETALKRNRRLELVSVIAPYSLYIFYAISSILIVFLLIQYQGYNVLKSVISLKGAVVDNLLLLLVFFYGIQNKNDALSVIRAIVWIVMLANLVTIIDVFNVPNLGLIHERMDGRIGGPIGESNQYAAFLALFLPACIALALEDRGLRRAVTLFGVAITVLALLMTASRGGIVGIVGGAILGAVFLRQYVSVRMVVTALASLTVLSVVALGILISIGYGDLLYERFVGLNTRSGSFDISSGRTVIWSTAVGKMFDQPLSMITGFGWDTYSQYGRFRFAPHNSYLKIFFELGFVGLLLILISFGSILRMARLGLRYAEGESEKMLFAFIFGLFSILVAILFVDISTPWIFIWAYVGVTMRLAVEQSRTPKLGVSGG